MQSDYEMEVEFNDGAEARRRFESSLPENWVLCSSKTHSGRLYYFNSVTGESRWEHPLIPDMDPPVSFNLAITRHVTIIFVFFITKIIVVETRDFYFDKIIFKWSIVRKLNEMNEAIRTLLVRVHLPPQSPWKSKKERLH